MAGSSTSRPRCGRTRCPGNKCSHSGSATARRIAVSHPWVTSARRQSSVTFKPPTWPAEYTTELLNVLDVMGRLIELEPKQAKLLTAICKGKLIDADAVSAVIA